MSPAAVAVRRAVLKTDTPLTAAIYVRKSVAKSDKSISLAEQIKTCTVFVESNGWTVGAVYEEKEGTSGTAIGDRPKFKQLRDDLSRFDVVVAVDMDRLARGSDLPKIVKDCQYADVRIMTVNDDFDSDRANAEKDSHYNAAASVDAKNKTARRVHATLKMKASEGSNPGGRAYGLRIHYELHPTELDDKKRRKIVDSWLEQDPETAPIVLRIFEMYADGMTPHAIAARLNADGIPSPRGGKWLATAISSDPERQLGIINNSAYIGKPFWNKTKGKKHPDTGAIKFVPRPPKEWTEMPEDPDLAIVTPALWERVRARQASRRQKRGAPIRKALSELPKRRGGRDSRYWLGGILKCGVCGSNLVGDGRVDYVCHTHTSGGCKNDRRIRRDAVHEKVFDVVREHLSNPEVIASGRAYVESVLREQIAAQTAARHSAVDGTQVKRINEQIATLRGLNLPPAALSAAVAELEREREEFLALASASVDRKEIRAERLLQRLPEIYAERCKAIEIGVMPLPDQDSLRGAREAMRSLLVDGKIVVYPEAETSGVTGTIAFVELGEEQLNLAGMRRSLGYLVANRQPADLPKRFIGRGDRI